MCAQLFQCHSKKTLPPLLCLPLIIGCACGGAETDPPVTAVSLLQHCGGVVTVVIKSVWKLSRVGTRPPTLSFFSTFAVALYPV